MRRNHPTSQSRIAFILLISSVALLAIVRTRVTLEGQLRQPRHNLEQLDDQQVASRSDDQGAVRQFVDALIDKTSPISLDHQNSLRARISRTEFHFRHGRHSRISEATVIDQINQMVDLLGGPVWMKTNGEQMRLFRTALKQHLPHVVGTLSGSDGRPQDEMTPVEAIFVPLQLLNSKMTQQEFQIAPAEWVGRVRSAKMAKLQLRSPSRQIEEPNKLLLKTEDPAIGEVRRRLQAALADEASLETSYAHLFLDHIGFAR